MPNNPSLPYPFRARSLWFHPRRKSHPKTRLTNLSPFKRFQIFDDIIDLLCIKPERGLARVTCREALGERLGKVFNRVALMHLAQRRCIWHRTDIGLPDRMATRTTRSDQRVATLHAWVL